MPNQTVLVRHPVTCTGRALHMGESLRNLGYEVVVECVGDAADAAVEALLTDQGSVRVEVADDGSWTDEQWETLALFARVAAQAYEVAQRAEVPAS